jgi:thiol-disulfide isomerase/thioredoxin
VRVFASMVLAVLLLSACQESDMRLADGSEGRFDQYQGNWLLINYWAEWCGPCRDEIPELNELHHQGETNGIVVLGVNYDGLVGEKLTDLIGTMDIEFPVLLDDPRLRWQQETPAVLPTTFLINPDGELAEVLVGPQSLDSLTAAVARHAQTDQL